MYLIIVFPCTVQCSFMFNKNTLFVRKRLESELLKWYPKKAKVSGLII